MIALLAAALLGASDPPPDPEPGSFLRLRMGAWAGRGFEFEADRAGGVRVTSDGSTMASAGIDVGTELYRGVILFGTVEESAARNQRARAAGAYLGYRERPAESIGRGVPDEVTLYAGGLWGSFEVDESGFGDFDDAFGFGGGIELAWRLGRSSAISLLAEYRFLEFDYEPDVTGGDTKAGGSTGWLGIGIDLRF